MHPFALQAISKGTFSFDMDGAAVFCACLIKSKQQGFEDLEAKVDDKITKALAKGATETDAGIGQIEESFI